MTLKITLAAASGTLPEYMEQQHGRVARAATATMTNVKDKIVNGGRASIAAAGFSARMQNSLRGRVFPRSGYSIDAAAWVWHRAPWAVLFEDGGKIVGSPYLWLPLPSARPRLGSKKMSPSLLASKGVELVSITGRSNKPLLGATVRLRRTQLTNPKPSLAQLRRGKDGVKGRLYTIPLFHGIKSVSVGKKIDIRGVAAKVSREIPSLFASHFSKEE